MVTNMHTKTHARASKQNSHPHPHPPQQPKQLTLHTCFNLRGEATHTYIIAHT